MCPTATMVCSILRAYCCITAALAPLAKPCTRRSPAASFAHTPDIIASGIDIATFRGNQISPTMRAFGRSAARFQIIDQAITERYRTISRQEGARVSIRSMCRKCAARAHHQRVTRLRFMARWCASVFPTYRGCPRLAGKHHDRYAATAQLSRNPSLAQFLFHASYIEKFGMGPTY